MIEAHGPRLTERYRDATAVDGISVTIAPARSPDSSGRTSS
jgi:hypothetical protein